MIATRLFLIVSIIAVGCSFSAFAQDVVEPKTIGFEFKPNERIAFVGNCLAERMNLFGYLEARLHFRCPDKNLVVRNFGWPADEVGIQQRPDNYTTIDDPLQEFDPDLFICFFGYNEHFAGDTMEALERFNQTYLRWIDQTKTRFSRPDRTVRFILISPTACEPSVNRLRPDSRRQNAVLRKYAEQIRVLAESNGYPFVDLFEPTARLFESAEANSYTINGVHLNEAGYALIAAIVDQQLFAAPPTLNHRSSEFQRVLTAVNDKSWYHMQDYRMLNGWYVYGGRRTWDTETFPVEYRKIRKMVAVRDRILWDLVNGKPVPDVPDDSQTGDVVIPETMFGTRDDAFRKFREPKTLEYPTPEQSIAQMTLPAGFQVQLFASEREFPELSNPAQIAFDNRGRLWVSCMTNYPQWLPGASKPGDKLLVFVDLDQDGRADECKTFYDKLICPTGFEFYQDGVLVVDEPRIIFLRDTDQDDVADEVTHLIDGIATDDTHHAMSAWEWSHGGLLYMLEGISMSTTMETPWGPVRNKGPSGAYVFDPLSFRFRYFKTPGYGNPWCMVFDRWGMGIVGDGTNAQQHWTSPLSGYPVESRKTLRPNFDNQGIRPAVGSDFLLSRHLPDNVQGQFIYACVIDLHGLPRFEMTDEPKTAGYHGQRVDDLIHSTDNFFRPVDPQIGPDGAVWFGDWCNALIGHMQYSQRDPNRDHEHGRIYRLIHTGRPLLRPELQHDKSIAELLSQLTSYELRTRYRARRELRARPAEQVLAAVADWIAEDLTDDVLCEALWIQESFRQVDPALVERLSQAEDFHPRAAAVHVVANEIDRFPNPMSVFRRAIADPHPRVRLEALRGLSLIRTLESLEVALTAIDHPMDYWLEYTLEHTLQALAPITNKDPSGLPVLPNASPQAARYLRDFVYSSGPGGDAVVPLRDAQNPELEREKREQAVAALAAIEAGRPANGRIVYERLCSACHQIKDAGKLFGPPLDGIAARFNKPQIIRHVLWPNESIAQGFETVRVLTIDGQVLNGFVLRETDTTLSMGVATDDGKGKQVDVPLDDIDERREMKASSMPEGLMQTVAPIEFLDLIAFLDTLLADKDDWIATGLPTELPLRELKQWVEISRDAQIRIGADFPVHWNRDAHMALSATGASNREFAFHSPEPPIENPHVLIRLAGPADIRHVQIQNRRNPNFYDRASGLSIWVSNDAQLWEKVWSADKPAPSYDAEFPDGIAGQFLKIGLDRKGIFHLNQVVVFGPKQSKN